MPISFPSNPSVGNTYDFGGIHYIYNGDGWVNKSIYGISAGSNISFANYNGTGPLVISASSTSGGITSAVTTINGLSGAVGISAGQDMSISIVGNTLAFSSPTVYGISANIYASNLATGLLHGGIISINAGNTAQFDITSGRGQIHASGSTYTADPQPVFNYVTWPAQTGITVTNLATSDTTWLYIDSSGNVQQKTEYYTDEQLETTIIIGQLDHPSRTYIDLARTNPNVAYATDKQYEQFIRSFGPIKVSGHSISPNGANLKLNRTSGKAFGLGRNWINNTDDPSVVSDPAQTDCTFFRYYRGITAGSFITVPNQTAIDPTKYDDGSGTLATVPGGKYTIQRLFYYPNTPTLLGVYYGRAEYNSISVAAANIDLENFSEIENTRTNAIFAGYLIVKSGATDLTNTADALIIQSGSFRSTSSGGGSVSITLDDLTDVIISSPIDYQVLTYVDGLTGWENKSVSQLPLVSSFNGLTGAVQGVSAAAAGTGISVSGATGSVTITNTGVLSFNGNTGAIQGVSSINGFTGAITNVAFTNIAQSFSGLQQFTQGISGSGGVTFASDITINGIRVGIGAAGDPNSIVIGATACPSGTYNVAIGREAMRDSTGAVNNVAIGYHAARDIQGGINNVAIGANALDENENGSVNVAIGSLALSSSTASEQNTAIGSSSLQNTTTGFRNVAIGYLALEKNSSGVANVAIGHAAGAYRGDLDILFPNDLDNEEPNVVFNRTTGTGGIYIGQWSRASANGQTNEIVIGTNAVGLGSNTAVIGATGQVSATIYGLFNAPGGVSAAGGTFSGQVRVNGNLFANNIVNTLNGLTGGVTFLAGSNITLTSGVPGITIAATSGGGGISRSISNISTDTSAGSAASTDYVYICTAGLTLTLPTAVSNTNRYSVKNNTASVVRIYTTSSQTIDGITFFNLNRQYQAIDLISDNSNWSIF